MMQRFFLRKSHALKQTECLPGSTVGIGEAVSPVRQASLKQDITTPELQKKGAVLQKRHLSRRSLRSKHCSDAPQCAGPERLRPFWTFVGRALMGAESTDPVCRQFRLEPELKEIGAQRTERCKVDDRVLAGIRLVFGSVMKVLPCKDPATLVHVVAATQRWAMQQVEEFSTSLHAKKPGCELPVRSYLDVHSVGSMLARFAEHK
eukprot:875007-Amphidinium_carterae.1